jgi:hypothetical protein
MSAREAIVLELFALLLTLFGGFTVLATDLTSERWALYAGFYLGLFALVYGLVGARVREAFQDGV